MQAWLGAWHLTGMGPVFDCFGQDRSQTLRWVKNSRTLEPLLAVWSESHGNASEFGHPDVR